MGDCLRDYATTLLMFSLLYGFWEYIFRKEEFRILVVGIDNAGKTTFLEKLKPIYSALPGLDPDKILPTVGLNVGRVEAHNSLLVFWDLGGQAGLRPIWDKYYSDSHGIIFAVDSSQPQRFAESKDALERALGSRDLFGAPILVLANKQVNTALGVPSNHSWPEFLAPILGDVLCVSRPCMAKAPSKCLCERVCRESNCIDVSRIDHSNTLLAGWFRYTFTQAQIHAAAHSCLSLQQSHIALSAPRHFSEIHAYCYVNAPEGYLAASSDWPFDSISPDGCCFGS